MIEVHAGSKGALRMLILTEIPVKVQLSSYQRTQQGSDDAVSWCDVLARAALHSKDPLENTREEQELLPRGGDPGGRDLLSN